MVDAEYLGRRDASPGCASRHIEQDSRRGRGRLPMPLQPLASNHSRESPNPITAP